MTPISLGIFASSYRNTLAVNGAGYLFSPSKDGSGTFASTRIEKFNFVTESRTTISATMPDARGAAAGFGDATTAGYVSGGILYPSVYDTTQKLTYSSETRTQISSTFSNARFNNKGFANSGGVAGYFAGGQDLSSFFTTIRKLPFSNETWQNISNSLTTNRSGAGTCSNPTVNGYFFGGYNGSTTVSSSDKMAFSNETVSALSNSLPSARDNLGAMSDTGNNAYIVGGSTMTSIWKMPYSTEAFSTLSATMPYNNAFSAYWSCPANFAAVAGARTNYPDVTDAIQKIDYATDTRTTFSAVLQQAEETSNYGVSNATLGA